MAAPAVDVDFTQWPKPNAAGPHMDGGVRDLRKQTGRVIDAVRAGKRVTLTVHGGPVADIVRLRRLCLIERPRDRGAEPFSCPLIAKRAQRKARRRPLLFAGNRGLRDRLADKPAELVAQLRAFGKGSLTPAWHVLEWDLHRARRPDVERVQGCAVVSEPSPSGAVAGASAVLDARTLVPLRPRDEHVPAVDRRVEVLEDPQFIIVCAAFVGRMWEAIGALVGHPAQLWTATTATPAA